MLTIKTFTHDSALCLKCHVVAKDRVVSLETMSPLSSVEFCDKVFITVSRSSIFQISSITGKKISLLYLNFKTLYLNFKILCELCQNLKHVLNSKL